MWPPYASYGALSIIDILLPRRYYVQGWTFVTVAALLGHSRIDTTDLYPAQLEGLRTGRGWAGGREWDMTIHPAKMIRI